MLGRSEMIVHLASIAEKELKGAYNIPLRLLYVPLSVRAHFDGPRALAEFLAIRWLLITRFLWLTRRPSNHNG